MREAHYSEFSRATKLGGRRAKKYKPADDGELFRRVNHLQLSVSVEIKTGQNDRIWVHSRGFPAGKTGECKEELELNTSHRALKAL